MNKIMKCSLFPALLLALSSVAYADSISVNSGAGSTGYVGYQAATWNGTTLGAFAGPNLTRDLTPAATYNLGTGGVWTAPIGTSQWVSYNANTGPGGSLTAPSGYYEYQQTFTAAGGVYSGSISVMADDSVQIYVDGDTTPIVTFGALGSDAKCADDQPNCTSVDTISLSDIDLLAGTNYLTIYVEQTIFDTGVDYSMNLMTPEGGAALMYLLLAGAACFGAMLFSRRNQLGKCEAA